MDIWLEADQRAECVGDGGVEVEEVVPRPLEEGVEVISIILEEWALAVGRTERTPVDPSPVAVVADAHVAHYSFVEPSVIGLLHGYGERLRPVGCGDQAAVAVGLLDEVVAALYVHALVAVHLLPPLDRGEVGRTEQSPTRKGVGHVVVVVDWSQHPYLMFPTHVKRRDQRMPLKPCRSGSLDHQTKSGLPTMWSSGTKPQ